MSEVHLTDSTIARYIRSVASGRAVDLAIERHLCECELCQDRLDWILVGIAIERRVIAGASAQTWGVSDLGGRDAAVTDESFVLHCEANSSLEEPKSVQPRPLGRQLAERSARPQLRSGLGTTHVRRNRRYGAVLAASLAVSAAGVLAAVVVGVKHGFPRTASQSEVTGAIDGEVATRSLVCRVDAPDPERMACPTTTTQPDAHLATDGMKEGLSIATHHSTSDKLNCPDQAVGERIAMELQLCAESSATGFEWSADEYVALWPSTVFDFSPPSALEQFVAREHFSCSGELVSPVVERIVVAYEDRRDRDSFSIEPITYHAPVAIMAGLGFLYARRRRG